MGIYHIPQNPVEFRNFRVYTSLLLFALAAIYAQTQPDAAKRIRQIGEVHIVGQRVLPGFDFLRQRRLRQTVGHYAFVIYIADCEIFTYILHYLVQRRLRLERHARHRVEHGVVSKAGGRETEYHYRRRAPSVDDHFAALRHRSLRPVDVEHIQASRTQNFAHHLQLPFVFIPVFAAVELGQRRLGDIVLGRAQSSRDYHDLVGPEFFAQTLNDVLPVIRYGNHSCDLDSQTVKFS